MFNFSLYSFQLSKHLSVAFCFGLSITTRILVEESGALVTCDGESQIWGKLDFDAFTVPYPGVAKLMFEGVSDWSGTGFGDTFPFTFENVKFLESQALSNPTYERNHDALNLDTALLIVKGSSLSNMIITIQSA
jgi:hypothetical protein